jgi:tetratricopeptide (TPR) repeat protein
VTDPTLAASLGDLESEWIGNPSPTVCARLSDLLRQTGRLEEASQLAAEGLRRWPGSSTIGIVLGRSLRESGKLESAAEAFEMVLATQPLNLVALRSLGEISFLKRKWRKAMDCLEEYLLEHSADQEALEMLQQARLNADNPDPMADDDEEEPEVHEPEASPAAFPETGRMARVLEAQGITPPSLTATADAGKEPAPNGAFSLPVEPASLLDLFSEEERTELGLGSFDGDLI